MVGLIFVGLSLLLSILETNHLQSSSPSHFRYSRYYEPQA
jgi:hypothetical protein